MQSVIDSRISVLLSTLDERDVEPVIEKIGTIVKAMKNVRQQFEDCTVFHYE
jgi:ribosomal protein L12E/L44/L45/RPP1/RPP2